MKKIFKIILSLFIVLMLSSLWFIRYKIINKQYSDIKITTIYVAVDGTPLHGYNWGISSVKHDIKPTHDKSNGLTTFNDNVETTITAKRASSFPNTCCYFINDRNDTYESDIFNEKKHGNYMSGFSDKSDRHLRPGKNIKTLNYLGDDISKQNPPRIAILRPLDNGSYIKYIYKI